MTKSKILRAVSLVVLVTICSLFALQKGLIFSKPSTSVLVKEVREEFNHQLEVINTGVPNKPFPNSKYASDWSRHSMELAKSKTYFMKQISKQKMTPLRLKVGPIFYGTDIPRTDFLAEPRIKVSISYVWNDCQTWRKSDQKCLKWDSIESAEGDHFEVMFWEVDGKWRIKDFSVHDEIRFPAAGDVLNWRCWSIKTGFERCPALYSD